MFVVVVFPQTLYSLILKGFVTTELVFGMLCWKLSAAFIFGSDLLSVAFFSHKTPCAKIIAFFFFFLTEKMPTFSKNHPCMRQLNPKIQLGKLFSV